MPFVSHAEPQKAARARRFQARRLLAWLIDLVVVSSVAGLAWGALATPGSALDAFRVSVLSAALGAAYFLIFAGRYGTTPGLALVRGSLRASGGSLLAGTALFAAMLLPAGVILLALDPLFDAFGAFGVEVSV